MVLESLIRPRLLLRKPFLMLFLAVVLTSVAIWISYFTFPNSASVLNIAFVTIALVPIMHAIFIREESMEVENPGVAIGFIVRHFNVIKVYVFFFLGLIICYSFWYVILPSEVKEKIFLEQDSELNRITNLKKTLSGGIVVVGDSCGNDFMCWFNRIFFNNSSVLLWAVLFSFLFGAGAIFLITWNASIIGVVIGRDIGNLAQNYAALGHLNLPAAYFHGLFNAIGLLPHGIPELLGYFVGAIAGAIISAAISKKTYKTNEFEIIAKDALTLILIALFLLLVGAVIESYLIISS